jgi:polysaccharide export outer membrane protein
MQRWLAALFLVLIIWAPAAAQAPSGGGAVGQPAFVAGTGQDYRLGAGDKLRITVFGEDSLTGEYFVAGGSGMVAFPLVGDVRASGLTVEELRQALEAKLRDGYLKEPRVAIEVLNYRPFFILGEVAKPGEYPYTNGLTVLNAVATANGFTYRADTRKVFIRRANAGGEAQYPLTATTAVEPGDTIRIGERFF